MQVFCLIYFFFCKPLNCIIDFSKYFYYNCFGDNMNCIFCKIVNGEIPSYKIYEDEKIMAFLDINPYSPGHTLIIPKEHTLDINSIDDDTLMHIMKHAKIISKDITSKLNAEGFTLIQNNGFVQEVKHFHLHVIPKYKEKFEINIKEVYEKITH